MVYDTSLIAISYIENPSKSFGLFVTLVYTLNASINGWVYLSMNQLIRGAVKRLLWRKLKTIRRESNVSVTDTKISVITNLSKKSSA